MARYDEKHAEAEQGELGASSSAAGPGKQSLVTASSSTDVQRREMREGKQTGVPAIPLTSPVQQRAAGAGDAASNVVAQDQAWSQWVQLSSGGQATQGPEAVHAAAAQGIATPGSPLPHRAEIQRSFGHHDISAIEAHTGPDAARSAHAMGADAFATRNHVVLGDRTDLHTVAHEAAHVVQQRRGVQLKGGVGAAGDAYERHADAVADRVVAGQSAADLLDGATASGVTQAVQRKEGKDDATLLDNQAKLKGTDVEIPALEGALLATRLEAVKQGLLSQASFDAGLALSQAMTRLQPAVAANGPIDVLVQETAAIAAHRLFASLRAETADDKNFKMQPARGDELADVSRNPYTEEMRVTTVFTQATRSSLEQLPVLIRQRKWDPAFSGYRQILDGLDLWVADQLRKRGKGTPEEARGNAHQHHAQLRTGLEQIAGKHATRLPALFHPDSKTVEKEKAASTIPMNVYFWKDEKDDKYHLYDLTTPSRPHEQTIDGPPTAAMMNSFFEEVARYPVGEVRYTLPDGGSGVAATTGKTKWYEWVGYAGLAIAAVGLAVLSAGASVPATYCFAAGALLGSVSAAGHLVDTVHLGTATTATVVLDVAQIAASFASAGAMNITLKAGGAAAALASSRWFVPLVDAAGVAGGVQLVALTDITYVELTKIQQGAGTAEDKQRATSVLLTQLVVMGGLTALAVKGARDARALSGKQLELVEQSGSSVLRVVGEDTSAPVTRSETKVPSPVHPTTEPVPHSEGKAPTSAHETPTAEPPNASRDAAAHSPATGVDETALANGKGISGERSGNGTKSKTVEGDASVPDKAGAEVKQGKIDAALEADLKTHGLENDPMFQGMEPQTRGKVSTALKNDPIAKAGKSVQDAALKWAKDGAGGNPREFANRYEYARAKFSEIRSGLAPDYNGKPSGKTLLNEAAGRELSSERLAKDLAADNAAAHASGLGRTLDTAKLPDKPSPDDIGSAVRGLDRFGFESDTATSYHAVKHQAELPEPKLAQSPVESYNAYAKDTIKTGNVVKAEHQPNGSTLVIIQKSYGAKRLEAILYIKPDGTVTLASYGQAKAVTGN